MVVSLLDLAARSEARCESPSDRNRRLITSRQLDVGTEGLDEGFCVSLEIEGKDPLETERVGPRACEESEETTVVLAKRGL